MSKDYRQEIISELCNKKPLLGREYSKGFEDAISIAIDTICEIMPDGDLEPVKHAHWTVVSYVDALDGTEDSLYVCSACKYAAAWIRDRCPKCKAVMDERGG